MFLINININFSIFHVISYHFLSLYDYLIDNMLIIVKYFLVNLIFIYFIYLILILFILLIISILLMLIHRELGLIYSFNDLILFKDHFLFSLIIYIMISYDEMLLL